MNSDTKATDTINTFFDFCSGIGAGRLGLELNGLRCVGRSDTSRLADITYCLLHESGGEKNYGNLKRIKCDQIPDFDMLIAGFPCQTFSVMGRKAGFDDSRGQIIFHLAEIIGSKKPKCFLLENVRGLTTHDNGKTFQIIIDLLKNKGYSIYHKVLNSIDYGVPQMRWRIYVVGFRNDLKVKDFEFPDTVEKPHLFDGFLVDDYPISKENLEILPYYLNNKTNQGKYAVRDLLKMEGKVLDTRMSDLRIYDDKVPTLRAQRDGLYYVHGGKIYQMSGYEALLLQGFPSYIAKRARDKVTDRHLLTQAGNAMTVNVIQSLGQLIINKINS